MVVDDPERVGIGRTVESESARDEGATRTLAKTFRRSDSGSQQQSHDRHRARRRAASALTKTLCSWRPDRPSNHPLDESPNARRFIVSEFYLLSRIGGAHTTCEAWRRLFHESFVSVPR